LAIGVNGNIAFPVIAVGIGGGVHKFKAIMKHMEKHFDQVDFGEANACGVFDMLTNERRAHFFYESKAEYPFAQAPNALTTQQIVEKTLSELPGPSLNPFNDDFLFVLNCPLTSRVNDEMREILAIYCCMLHLGSLVRYRPDVLEGMLSTRD